MWIKYVTCISALVISAGCAVPQPQPKRAFTMALPQPPQPKTNGTTWLKWNPGIPAETTVRNVTTGEEFAAGPVDNYVVRGLPLGSTNTFVVHNAAGFSNEATGVAAPPPTLATITVHTFLVELPVIPGVSNVILTSNNLLTWSELSVIVATNSVYTFLWTNDHTSRFFRSKAP